MSARHRTATPGLAVSVRVLTAQRGGEVSRCGFPTCSGEHVLDQSVCHPQTEEDGRASRPYLIPARADAVAIIPDQDVPRNRSWRERMRPMVARGTARNWGWPRAAISDFVFPSRTDPAPGRNFWAGRIKELSEKAAIDDFKPTSSPLGVDALRTRCGQSLLGGALSRHEDRRVGRGHLQPPRSTSSSKTYVAYASENKVREAIGKRRFRCRPRPRSEALCGRRHPF